MQPLTDLAEQTLRKVQQGHKLGLMAGALLPIDQNSSTSQLQQMYRNPQPG